MKSRKTALQILEKLQALYPGVEPTLENWDGVDWKFLFAVIMSAQTTDKQVNFVTKKLFQKLPTLRSFVSVEIGAIEKLIRSVGFHKTKAKHLQQTAQILLNSFNGKVPLEMAKLITLPGVGRKTANVVTGTLMEENYGIAVDTHVARVSKRIGLTRGKNPEQIEQDLMKFFPREVWSEVSLLLIYHGRQVCKAQKPECINCEFKELCEHFKNNQ